MLGCDVSDASPEAWLTLARWFAEEQIRAITDGAMLGLSSGDVPAFAPVVGAGIGETALREVARRLGRDYIPFEALLDLAPEARPWASHCAPATALAILACDTSLASA
jgi:hypothetical protein